MIHTTKLREANVRVRLNRTGRLVARHPDGKVPAKLVKYIKAHRDAIIAELEGDLIELLWQCSDAGVFLEADDGVLIISGKAAPADISKRLEAGKEGLCWLLSPPPEDA